MGTSYVLVHTPKGEELWSACAQFMEKHQVPFETTIQYNRAYFESPHVPSGREEFMQNFRDQSLKHLGDYLIEGSWYIRYPRRFYYSVRTHFGTFLRKLGVRR